MDDGEVIIRFVLLIVRIFITGYCINRAGELNRSKWGWGLFGFFIPIVAIIWIQFMKPVMVWDKDVDINQEKKG